MSEECSFYFVHFFLLFHVLLIAKNPSNYMIGFKAWGDDISTSIFFYCFSPLSFISSSFFSFCIFFFSLYAYTFQTSIFWFWHIRCLSSLFIICACESCVCAWLSHMVAMDLNIQEVSKLFIHAHTHSHILTRKFK